MFKALFGCSFVVLLALASTGFCSSQSPAVVRVSAGKLKAKFTCAAGVELGDIRDGILHADLHRAASRYLLIAYSELSRPSAPNGRCGGGVESYLVWMELHRATIRKVCVVQFESCWKEIEVVNGPAWRGHTCLVEFSRFIPEGASLDDRQAVTSEASFNALHPEEAIKVQVESIE